MSRRHSALLKLKVILSSLTLVASTAFYGIRAVHPLTDADCTELLFPGSPANEATEYHWENFRDHYIPYAVYRGPPTPEREAAWDAFTPFGVVGVSPSYPSSFKEAFAVPGAVLQMNCLKLLRQFVYRDHNQTLFTPPSRQQADRCISVLREHLVCSCDATPYLIANNPNFPRGIVPVTGNDHYCRSYEKVLEWTGSRLVSPHHSLLDSSLVV
ncbi:hypothetical protein QBC47DRAFT_392117 [Echria macrotheca]|uniref:Uncharacterized protein n=1 Tax=Echria macrotheca TaxID=438768 RepID=A0AAJ0F2E5_9PEZI|nr:hypothetical protein QBC47DRAFT_392117 [Echria macrotheca]